MENTVKIPAIITANTFFWKPAMKASQRRSNEERRLQEVASFFEQNGFDISFEDNKVFGRKGNIEITFFYKESTQKVYKNVEVFVDGSKRDIRKLYEILEK